MPTLCWLSQVTRLSLAQNQLETEELGRILSAMPSLSICDISGNVDLFLEPPAIVRLLQRCSTLRHVYCESAAGVLANVHADALMQIQRAVPRVCWQLEGAPKYENLVDTV